MMKKIYKKSQLLEVNDIPLEVIEGIGGVYGLGVLPEYRGQGYGRGILNLGIEKLKLKNAKSIMLQVVVINNNALKTVPVGIMTFVGEHGTDYGYGAQKDSLPHGKYIEWLGKIAVEGSRVLRPCGRMIVVFDSVGVRQDDEYQGKKYTVYPDLIAKVRELDCGLLFKDEICWDKIRHGGRATAWGSYLSPASPNIRRRHEYVVIWQKGAGPLENITDLPSDLTKAEWMQSIYSTWEIPIEGRRHGNHPAPFPEELIRRLIRLYSYPGDLSVDPMNGAGTTTAVAASLGRRWLGIDLNPDYCKYALKRTQAAGK